MDIKSILNNLGYKLTKDGRYYRTSAVYRGGDNPTALRISAKNGYWIDFPARTKGYFTDLVQLSLGKTPDETKSWLAQNEFELSSTESNGLPIIEKSPKYYDLELLSKLISNNQYWNNRGITDQTLSKYKGGIALSGVMYNRYVFPCFDKLDRIIGFAGRDLTSKSLIKWKIIGSKYDFIFPIKNLEHIREKQEVILLESIGDLLALEEAGINTGLVLFGVSLSDTILSKISGLMPQKIIIALNNDENNGGVGQKAAKDVERRLLQFFNPEKVQIKIPAGYKDFGEMPQKMIQEWYNA